MTSPPPISMSIPAPPINVSLPVSTNGRPIVVVAAAHQSWSSPPVSSCPSVENSSRGPPPRCRFHRRRADGRCPGAHQHVVAIAAMEEVIAGLPSMVCRRHPSMRSWPSPSSSSIPSSPHSSSSPALPSSLSLPCPAPEWGPRRRRGWYPGAHKEPPSSRRRSRHPTAVPKPPNDGSPREVVAGAALQEVSSAATRRSRGHLRQRPGPRPPRDSEAHRSPRRPAAGHRRCHPSGGPYLIRPRSAPGSLSPPPPMFM